MLCPLSRIIGYEFKRMIINTFTNTSLLKKNHLFINLKEIQKQIKSQ